MKTRTLFIGVYFLLIAFCACAQDGSVSITPVYDDAYLAQHFCGGITNLLADAAKKFGKAKGKEIETHGDIAIWSSNMGMLGAITSSLLFTTSWHYEGVVYQGSAEQEMAAAYSKYNRLLETCMSARGYSVSTEKSTETTLARYPVVVYTRPAEGGQVVPHVSMEVAYVEQTKTYTLVVNVWE